MKKTLSILLISIVAISCQPEKKEEVVNKLKKVPVRIAKVTKQSLLIPITSQGKLSAGVESELSFKVSGIIERIHVNEGQVIKRGQTIASLDMSEINAQVNQAKAAFEKAERDLQRMRNLYKDKVITLEALQNAETSLQMAESGLEIAEFNRQYSTIKAPGNGQILKLKAEENEIVAPGTTVFEFANTQQAWKVTVGLIDREVVNLVHGDSATIYFDALPNRPFDAYVSLIPNAAHPTSGTYEVEISLSEYDPRLRSGFYSKVNIYPSHRDEYAIVPMMALVQGDGRDGIVYTTSGDKVVSHKVHVEEFIDGALAVSGDLKESDYVITEGVEDLTANSEIEIVQ